MSLSREDVEKIAHLARLSVSEDDISKYANELSNILDLVEQMNAVDTGSVEPMAHPFDMAQRLRADAVTETDRHADFQAVAPRVEAKLYLVPKVIE